MKNGLLLIVLAVFLTGCGNKQSEPVDTNEEGTVRSDNSEPEDVGDESDPLNDVQIDSYYDIKSIEGETEEIRLLKSLNALYYNLGNLYSEFELDNEEVYNNWNRLMSSWSNDLEMVWDDIKSNDNISEEVNAKMLVASENLNTLGDFNWEAPEGLDKDKQEALKKAFRNESVEIGEMVNP